MMSRAQGSILPRQQESGKFYSAKKVPNEWEPGRATATITEIEFADAAE